MGQQGDKNMKIKRTTYDKIVRRRRWLKGIVEDLDTILKEIDEENPRRKKR